MKTQFILIIFILEVLFPAPARAAYATAYFTSEEDCLDKLLTDPGLFYAVLSMYDDSVCETAQNFDAETIFARARLIASDAKTMGEAMETANLKISQGFGPKGAGAVVRRFEQQVLSIDSHYGGKMLDNGVTVEVKQNIVNTKVLAKDLDEDASHLSNLNKQSPKLISTKISKQNVTIVKNSKDIDEDGMTLLKSGSNKSKLRQTINPVPKIKNLGKVNELVFKPLEFRLDGGFNAEFNFGGQDAFRLDTGRYSLEDGDGFGFNNVGNIHHNIVKKEGKLGDVDIFNIEATLADQDINAPRSNMGNSNTSNASGSMVKSNKVKPFAPGFDINLPVFKPDTNGLKSNENDQESTDFEFKKPTIRNEIIKRDDHLGSVEVKSVSLQTKSEETGSRKTSAKVDITTKTPERSHVSSVIVSNQTGTKTLSHKTQETVSNQTVQISESSKTSVKQPSEHSKTSIGPNDVTSTHSSPRKTNITDSQSVRSPVKSQNTNIVDEESHSNSNSQIVSQKNPSFNIDITPFQPNIGLKSPKSGTSSNVSDTDFRKPKITHDIIHKTNATNDVEIHSPEHSIASNSNHTLTGKTSLVQESSQVRTTTPKSSQQISSHKTNSPSNLTVKTPEQSNKSRESTSLSVQSISTIQTPSHHQSSVTKKTSVKSSMSIVSIIASHTVTNKSSLKTNISEKTSNIASVASSTSKKSEIPGNKYTDIQVNTSDRESHSIASGNSSELSSPKVRPDFSWHPDSNKIIDLNSRSENTSTDDITNPSKRPEGKITVIDNQLNPSNVTVAHSEVTGKKKGDSHKQTSRLTSDHDETTSLVTSQISDLDTSRTNIKSSANMSLNRSINVSGVSSGVKSSNHSSVKSIDTPKKTNITDSQLLSDTNSIISLTDDSFRSVEKSPFKSNSNPTSPDDNDMSEGTHIQTVHNTSEIKKPMQSSKKTSQTSSPVSTNSQPDSYKDKEDDPVPSSDYHSTTKKKNKYFAGKTIFVLQFTHQGRRLSGKSVDQVKMREEVLRLMGLLPVCIRRSLESCVLKKSEVLEGCQKWRGRECQGEGLTAQIKCAAGEKLLAGACYKNCPADMGDRMLTCQKRKIERRTTQQIEESDIGKQTFTEI